MGGTEYVAADVASTNTQYWLSSTGIDAVKQRHLLHSGDGLERRFCGQRPRIRWRRYQHHHRAPQVGRRAYLASPLSPRRFAWFRISRLASSPNNAGYLYCSSDSTSTGITGSCSNGFRDVSNTYLTVAGGTSFAAPIFAGMVAIINQSKGVTKGLGLDQSHSLYPGVEYIDLCLGLPRHHLRQ